MTKPHGVIEDIGAALGYTATTMLVFWFGGASLFVPREAREEHAIARIIGMPAYRRLVAMFGGESVWIPAARAPQAEARARSVLRLLAAGRTAHEIANEVGITKRRVEQIRKRLVAEGILSAISQNCQMALSI